MESHKTKLVFGPNVAAALASFKNKLPGAVFHKAAEQIRCGNVKITSNAVLLQAMRLIRPAARDNCEWWTVLTTTASCSSRSSAGTKPRMPTPHGKRRAVAWSLCQKSPHLRTTHQRQRQKWQATVLRHGVCESSLVAHARHGPLKDWILSTVRNGQRRTRRQGLCSPLPAAHAPEPIRRQHPQFRTRCHIDPQKIARTPRLARAAICWTREIPNPQRIQSHSAIVRAPAVHSARCSSASSSRIALPAGLSINAKQLAGFLSETNSFPAIGSRKRGTHGLWNA